MVSIIRRRPGEFYYVICGTADVTDSRHEEMSREFWSWKIWFAS